MSYMRSQDGILWKRAINAAYLQDWSATPSTKSATLDKESIDTAIDALPADFPVYIADSVSTGAKRRIGRLSPDSIAP
jgi:hypothetical protein